MKAYVINEHCMGCGLCIFKCPKNAMKLEVVRPPEYIKPRVAPGQPGAPVRTIPVFGLYDLK